MDMSKKNQIQMMKVMIKTKMMMLNSKKSLILLSKRLMSLPLLTKYLLL
jgi:hypothetical protein